MPHWWGGRGESGDEGEGRRGEEKQWQEKEREEKEREEKEREGECFIEGSQLSQLSLITFTLSEPSKRMTFK